MMQQVTNATGSPAEFSRPDSVLSLGNELYVKGTKPKDLQPDKLAAPTGASVTYDEAAGAGTVSWSYDSQAVEADGYSNISFTVTEQRADGSERVVGTTGETSINISNLAEGRTTFTIVANASNPLTGDQQSGGAQASYTIEAEEEAPPEEEQPATEETPPDENQDGETPPADNGGEDGSSDEGSTEENPTDEGTPETDPGTEEPPAEGDTGAPLEGQSDGQPTDEGSNNGRGNGNNNGNGNGNGNE